MNELLNQMLDKKWWIYLSVGQYAKYQSKNLHILHKDGHRNVTLYVVWIKVLYNSHQSYLQSSIQAHDVNVLIWRLL